MKKLLLVLLMIVFSALNLCYSQNNDNYDDYDNYDNENDDGIEYIYDSTEIRQVQRFGFGLPDIGTTRGRLSTEEEFIFKTYIMDKLLKSNRILY